jgi:hypothetical protein
MKYQRPTCTAPYQHQAKKQLPTSKQLSEWTTILSSVSRGGRPSDVVHACYELDIHALSLAASGYMRDGYCAFWDGGAYTSPIFPPQKIAHYLSYFGIFEDMDFPYCQRQSGFVPIARFYTASDIRKSFLQPGGSPKNKSLEPKIRRLLTNLTRVDAAMGQPIFQKVILRPNGGVVHERAYCATSIFRAAHGASIEITRPISEALRHVDTLLDEAEIL